MIERYVWEYEVSRYDLLYGEIGERNFICWLHRGGSGGVTLLWTGYLHVTYMMEKMNINKADANNILRFLEGKGHSVGLG